MARVRPERLRIQSGRREGGRGVRVERPEVPPRIWKKMQMAQRVRPPAARSSSCAVIHLSIASEIIVRTLLPGDTRPGLACVVRALPRSCCEGSLGGGGTLLPRLMFQPARSWRFSNRANVGRGGGADNPLNGGVTPGSEPPRKGGVPATIGVWRRLRRQSEDRRIE